MTCMGQIEVNFEFDPNIEFKHLDDYWVIEEISGKPSRDTVISQEFNTKGQVVYQRAGTVKKDDNPFSADIFSVWNYDNNDRLSSIVIYRKFQDTDYKLVTAVWKENYEYNELGKLSHNFLQTCSRDRKREIPIEYLIPRFGNQSYTYRWDDPKSDFRKPVYTDDWSCMNTDGHVNEYDENGLLESRSYYRNTMTRMRECKFKYNSDNKVEFIKCEESVPDSIHFTYTDSSKSEFGTYSRDDFRFINKTDSIYNTDGSLIRVREKIIQRFETDWDDPSSDWNHEERFYYDDYKRLKRTEFYYNNELTKIHHHYYRKK